MSAWRRRALHLFPALRRELNDPKYTVYLLYFDLLPMARAAHGADDADLLRRVYGFASWCWAQKADLRNAVAVAFYEHLFDERRDWEKVLPWFSREVVRDCWPLWEVRLTADELDELQQLMGGRRGRRKA